MTKNNAFVGLFARRTVGFYIGLLAAVTAIVSLVIYLMYGAAAGESASPWVVVPLLVVVAAQTATLFIDNDWIAALAPAVCMVALCRFVIDSVYTLVGYFFGLTMFGNVSMMPWIVKVSAGIAITLMMLIVSAFMRKRRN